MKLARKTVFTNRLQMKTFKFLPYKVSHSCPDPGQIMRELFNGGIQKASSKCSGKKRQKTRL